jgi:DNA polymerase-3 subunit alpha
MIENLEMLLEYHKEQAKDSAQDSLFGLMSDDSKIPDLSLRPAPPATMTNTLLWEKELLGLFISGHPLDKYREKLEKKELNIAKILEKSKKGTPVTLAGIIEEVRDVMTKNNERMLFLKIADLTGSIDAVVFPRTLQTQADIYKLDTCIVFVGKISKRNGETSIIIEKAKELE